MTGTLSFIDAAYPPNPAPYSDGVCGYIGGNAYHLWSAADWASQPARYRLPVWVRSDPTSVNPASDAATCVTALRALGAPRGCLVALDSETDVDAAWVRVFVSAVNAGGYRVIDYGSQSTVFGNDNPDGYYFGADWTNQPHIAVGDEMTQWISLANIDEDEAEASLPFWDTRPVPKPDPAPSYPSLSTSQEDNVMLIAPKTLTPLAIPPGYDKLLLVTEFGTTKDWQSVKVAIDWHGSTTTQYVEVNPGEVWPVVTVPEGVAGACLSIADGSHLVSVALVETTVTAAELPDAVVLDPVTLP